MNRIKELNRRDFLIKAGMLGSGLMATSVLRADLLSPPKPHLPGLLANKRTRPNILLIMTDQERNEKSIPDQVVFPNHQRLKKQSVAFTNYHITTSPCAPSRASIYTGKHLQQTRTIDNPDLPTSSGMDPDIKTIGDLLRQHDYHTAYKGKWHVSEIAETKSTGRELEGYGFSDYGNYGDRIGAGSREGYDWDPVTAGDAREWMLNRGKRSKDTAPWFLAVNLINPHDIMFHSTGEHQENTRVCNKVPAPIGRPVDDDIYKHQWNIDLPRSYYEHDINNRLDCHKNWAEFSKYAFGDIPSDDIKTWKGLQNHYFNCLMDVDQHLGTILDGLEMSGMADNTIVIYTSDHGEQAGAHGFRSKEGTAYRETLNVPLMIRVPGIANGVTTDALASAIDLVPTILSFAGVDSRTRKKEYPDLKGHDITPILLNPQKIGPREENNSGVLFNFSTIHSIDAGFAKKVLDLKCAEGFSKLNFLFNEPLFADFNKKSFIRCIHDGQYKFARYFAPNTHHIPEDFNTLIKYNQLELYDMQNDPHELHNLALNTGKYRDLIMVMNEKLNQLILTEAGEDSGAYMPGPEFLWRL